MGSAPGCPSVGFAIPAATCHGAAIAKKTSVPSSGCQRRRCARLRVIARYTRDDQEWKDEADQPLGQHAQRARGGESGGVRARRLRERAPEAEHRDRQPQAHHRIRNQNAGEDEQPEARREHERGIEAGHRVAEAAPAQREDHEQQQQRVERERQSRRPGMNAETAEARRHAPVQQRRLLQIADAVRVERRPVMTRHHLARHLCVHGVGVVQQRRPYQREAAVQQQPQRDHDP